MNERASVNINLRYPHKNGHVNTNFKKKKSFAQIRSSKSRCAGTNSLMQPNTTIEWIIFSDMHKYILKKSLC